MKNKLPTSEEVKKANEEAAVIILEKIMNNHYSPATICPKCKKGKFGQIPILIKASIADSVMCTNCGEIGMKCAVYKGEDSCDCQDNSKNEI